MHSKFRDVSVYQLCLALLVLMDGVSRLSVWSDESVLGTAVNALQLCLYALLVAEIVQCRYSLRTYAFVALSAMVFLVGWTQNHDSVFIRDVLLMLAARESPFDTSVRTMRHMMLSTVIIGVATVILGFVELQVYRRGGYSIGFEHPNQAALVFSVIGLTWLAERRRSLTGQDLAIVSLCVVFVYAITRSRTPLLLMAAAIILGICQMRHPDRRPGKVLTAIALLTPVTCLLLTYVTAMLLPTSQLVNRLDLLFSNRIWLSWYAFSTYKILPFGQTVDLTAGTGTVYNVFRGTWNNSITVDNTYTLCLLRLGLIPTIAFICWNTYALKRVAESGDSFLVSLGIILCIYGAMESQMMDVFNNFVLLGAYSLNPGMLSLKRFDNIQSNKKWLEMRHGK